MKQLKAPVTSTIEVMPDVYQLWLEAPEIAASVKPGQFVMVRAGDETYLPRPFSVYGTDGDRVALLFNVVGRGTRWLSRRKKGDSLDIFGPLGNGFTIDSSACNLLLVAGGMGIPPLRFLADRAAAQRIKITLIMGARTTDGLLPVASTQDSYDKGLPPADINVVNTTEDGSEGFKGMATDLIPHYIDGIDQVFACGPTAMYRAMSRLPELKKLSVQLSLEIVMGCGTGVCYGCTIRTRQGLKQVCQDGPVFEMGDIDWEKPLGI